MAYSVLGYLYETPTSNICCLFMTLLISTDEQLSQRGYRGACPSYVLLVFTIHFDRAVPPSSVVEPRLMQDREHQRPNFSFGHLHLDLGRENQLPEIDPDSDFEAPTPKNKGIRYKKGYRWYRRNKEPDLPSSNVDDERLRAYISPLRDFPYVNAMSQPRGNDPTRCV